MVTCNEWSSPRRWNASGFQIIFGGQGLGAHVARRTRTAAPRPRGTPLVSPRSFVSRRHKSCGDPTSRTELRSGQAIVREGVQRPVIKVYIRTRSSACVPAVAGTHAPRTGEGVEGLTRLLGDIITTVSCCRGSKG